MKQNLGVIHVANSLAVTSAMIYLVCIVAVWIVPQFVTTLGNYLLHGIDVNRLVTARSVTFSLISLIVGTIAGWLAGALFAIVYNKIK